MTEMFLTKCQIESVEKVSLKSCLIKVQTMQWSHALSSVNNWSPKTVTQAMECKLGSRARIWRPFKEPRNQFPAWWAGTTTLFFVPARHAGYIGCRNLFLGVDSWSLYTFDVYKYGLRSRTGETKQKIPGSMTLENSLSLCHGYWQSTLKLQSL